MQGIARYLRKKRNTDGVGWRLGVPRPSSSSSITISPWPRRSRWQSSLGASAAGGALLKGWKWPRCSQSENPPSHPPPLERVQCPWTLGVEDDTRGVLLLPPLEGGVGLLQILDDGQQPGGHAVTRLHLLHAAPCTVCDAEQRRWT